MNTYLGPLTFNPATMEFVDGNKCWFNFYHNETDWIKTEDLRSDFYHRLFELVSEGRHYILILNRTEEYRHGRWSSQEEVFIGNKEEVENRLEQAIEDCQDYETKFDDEDYTVYDVLKGDVCSVESVKTWKWS